MKKLFVLTLTLILGVVAMIGTRSGRGRAQAITMRHIVKDLPEHGLIIITASNPLFKETMSKFLALAQPGSDLSSHLNALKPFCAFLVNTGSQDVVAYKIKWELVGSDGTAKTKFSSTINPAKLMGEDLPGRPSVRGELRPGMTRLITWEPSLANVLYSLGSGQDKAASLDEKKVTEFLARMEEGLRRQAGGEASLTVALDGAFFADGVFVGPDTDNSFAEVQSYVEAKADLRRLIEDGKRRGKNNAEVLDDIKETFKNVSAAPSAHPTPADFKTLFTKMHADSLQKMREARGDDYAVNQTTLPPSHDAPKLRKKAN